MKLKKVLSLISIFLLGTSILSGCNSSSDTATSSVDYVNNGSVKLTLDYKDHDFYTEGVGQVTLQSPIDGDTAHFNPVVTTTSSDIIKARFWGIDTPESTGKVQEWGKAASNFTKAKLKEANENGTIVVSSPSTTYTSPSPDSTGTRYVSLVWINLTEKNASYDSLVLLNLWIVQDGYSWVKNVSDMPQNYQDTFYDAQVQAEALKLNMFSGEKDPLFNYGGYEDVSLLDIKKEIEKTIADSTYTNSYDNANVRVQGTVAGFSNHIIYITNFYTSDEGARSTDGEYAGVNIYVGMASIPSKYTTKNTYIEVCGVAEDSDEFGFQITSGSFPIVSTKDNDASVIITAANNTEEHALHTFQYAAEDLKAGTFDALFCAVELTDTVYCSGGYKGDSGAITLYLKSSASATSSLPFTCYFTLSYHPYPDSEVDKSVVWDDIDDFTGKTFNLKGVYGYHKTSSGKISYQILLSSYYDLALVG